MWQRWNQTTHIFEKSTDNGANWTPLGLNASIITEGIIGGAFLPSNIGYVSEGSWTPTLNGLTGPTYTTRVGAYIKIGKLVFITGRITLSNKGTGSGALTITGLPFTVGSGFSNFHAGFWQDLAAGILVQGYFVAGAASIQPTYVKTAAISQITNLTGADVGNSVDLLFSGTYIASS